MIGRSGERGSGISVLAARHEDDDIYIYIYIRKKVIRGNIDGLLDRYTHSRRERERERDTEMEKESERAY